MDALPENPQTLLSRVLSKIFIAIDALKSLRNVPVILEQMALRLTFLEYAMLFWRQAQSSDSQVKPQNASRGWRLFFSDKYLYFLFKDILLDCSKQWNDSDNAHTYAEVSALRRTSALDIYELAASPARAILRKVLDSSLRTLIEDLVLSNAARYGTWRDFRPLETSPRAPPGLAVSVIPDNNRVNVELQAMHRLQQILRMGLLEEMRSFQPVDTTHAKDTFDMCRIVIFIDALDDGPYTPAQSSFNTQNSWFCDVSSPNHWQSVSSSQVSKSTNLILIEPGVVDYMLRLDLPKRKSSQKTRRKIARSLLRVFEKISATIIPLHESEEGHYVRFYSICTNRIETRDSRPKLANAGATMESTEVPNSTGFIVRHEIVLTFMAILQSVAEAVTVSDLSTGRLLSSDHSLRSSTNNGSHQFTPVNPTGSFQQKAAAHRLSLSGVSSTVSLSSDALLMIPSYYHDHRYVQAAAQTFHACSSNNTELVRLLLNRGADLDLGDTLVRSARSLKARQILHAKPSRLDRSLVSIKASLSFPKDGVDAAVRIRGNDSSVEKSPHDRNAAVSERLCVVPEQLHTKKFPQIDSFSETSDDATDSVLPLNRMVRGLCDTPNLLGFWRRTFCGMLSRRNFNRLLRPRVPQNHVRLTWICHCGKELYGDFHNEDPSAVARLANRLRKRTQGIGKCSPAALLPATVPATQTAMQSSTSLTSGMSGTFTAPSSSSVPSSQTSQTTVNQVQPPPPCRLKASGSTSSSTSKVPSGLVQTGHNPVPGALCSLTQNQYVEMCVNTGKHYQRLAEIDVANHKTDADLFRWIRKRYGELRGWRTKWQYFLRPRAMSYVEFALDRKQKVHIFQRKDAYPPQAEIDAGRYMYSMPPPPIPSNTFIHYLRECDLDSYSGSQDNEILEIIAKKLDTRVSDHPSLSTKAYGMLVHEGPDVTAILWTMILIVAVMCGSLVAFIVLTKDVQSATGLAATALAVVTLLWMGLQIDRVALIEEGFKHVEAGSSRA